MSLPIVVFSSTDPAMVERVNQYARDLARLEALRLAVESDRSRNLYRRGGLFSPAPAPIPTESREIEIMRAARELELERAKIAGLIPVSDHLGGTLLPPGGGQ
jgi:hypothetical protein